MTGFTDSLRQQIRTADTLQRLLMINVILYLSIALTNGVLGLFMISFHESIISDWLAVPASLSKLFASPWTLITYMFYHYDFFHILFNMLWLYWMGKILQEYLGNKKLLSTYLLGGISGAVSFILAYNTLPLFQDSVQTAFALGASASVLAITVAAATLVPEYRVNLILIGAVPLKYIAIVLILLDVINVSKSNPGGHIAHLGGAIYGFIYILQLKKGRDIGKWLNDLLDRIANVFSSRSKIRVTYRRTNTDDEYLHDKKARQEKIDRILDKISSSGYGSLSKEERELLFKSSKEE